jgi:TonB family protein
MKIDRINRIDLYLRNPVNPVNPVYFLRRPILLKYLLILVMLYPILFCSPARAEQEIVRRLLPSIVTLIAQDPNGGEFIMGYGFFIDRWTIVTNHHILKDAQKKNVNNFYILTSSAKYYHVNYISTDTDNKLLFLDVEERGPQPLPLSKTNQLKSGERVYLIDAGTTAKSQAPGDIRLIEMTIPLPPEYTGHPVLDQSGLVLGIAIDTRAKSAPASGVIPAKELAGKHKQYLNYGTTTEITSTEKPTGSSSGSSPGTDSPTSEREAGGQTALQLSEAPRTPAADISDSSGVTSRPKVLKKVKAGYTPEARDAGINGSVMVSVIIDEQGEISNAKVVKGHQLLRLVSLRAARQCLFVPGMKDGVPVKVKSTMEFSFNLY